MSSGTLRVSVKRGRKLRSKGLTGKISPYAVFEILDGADGASRETPCVPDCGRDCSWNSGASLALVPRPMLQSAGSLCWDDD
jgi:hypothetical protein